MANAEFNPLDLIRAESPWTEQNFAERIRRNPQYTYTAQNIVPLDFGGIANVAFLKGLKAAYIARFKYEGDPKQIDPYMLEEFLWSYGQCAVVYHGGRYILGTFTTDRFDYNSDPVKIRLYTATQSNAVRDKRPLTKVFTVGEDAVIIRDDRSTFVNSSYQIAPMVLARQAVHVLQTIRSYIHHNIAVSRSIVPTSPLIAGEVITKMNAALAGGGTFVPIGTEFDTMTEKSIHIELKDRTVELWENYYNEYDHYKALFGFESNALPQKKERQQNKEIDSTNMIAKTVLNSKLASRERGMQALKKTFGVTLTVTLDEVATSDEQEQEEVQNGRAK